MSAAARAEQQSARGAGVQRRSVSLKKQVLCSDGEDRPRRHQSELGIALVTSPRAIRARRRRRTAARARKRRARTGSSDLLALIKPLRSCRDAGPHAARRQQVGTGAMRLLRNFDRRRRRCWCCSAAGGPGDTQVLRALKRLPVPAAMTPVMQSNSLRTAPAAAFRSRVRRCEAAPAQAVATRRAESPQAAHSPEASSLAKSLRRCENEAIERQCSLGCAAPRCSARAVLCRSQAAAACTRMHWAALWSSRV